MKVAWLHVAPVKGLSLESREYVVLGPNGVEDDRRFLLIDDDRRLVNGKRLAALTTIGAHFDPATNCLELRMPGDGAVTGTVALGEPVTVEGRQGGGHVVNGPWAAALSEELGRSVRLVHLDDAGKGHDRASKEGAATLLSLASLERLADEANVGAPVDARRFRMLIGIDGATAHEEDGWIGRRVHVGKAIVIPAGNVGRCEVTTLHPDRGVSDLPTLKVLADYRKGVTSSEPLAFGIWARVERPGRIALGDAITVEGEA